MHFSRRDRRILRWCAVEHDCLRGGVGRIVAAKQYIWPFAPVIGLRSDRAESHSESVSRLLIALDAAADWCEPPDNHEVLADASYIEAPVDIIRHVLGGQFIFDARGNRRVIERCLTFNKVSPNFPVPAQALRMYSQMISWGQARLTEEGPKAPASAYRPDLYRTALGKADMPEGVDIRMEGNVEGDRFMATFSSPPISAVRWIGSPLRASMRAQTVMKADIL